VKSNLKRLAVLVGLAVSLALPASAAVADASSTATESLSINAAFTLTGVSASYTYPATIFNATTAQLTTVVIPAISFASSSGGATLSVSGGALTGTPSGSILRTARQYDNENASLPANCASVTDLNGALVAWPAPDPWAYAVQSAGTGLSCSVITKLAINVPANTPAGTFAGSITFSVS